MLHGEEMIKNAQLESFDNRTQVRRYWIEFTCPEFTCLCPRSGFPDFATIHIKYSPDKKCVELKSLKLISISSVTAKFFTKTSPTPSSTISSNYWIRGKLR